MSSPIGRRSTSDNGAPGFVEVILRMSFMIPQYGISCGVVEREIKIRQRCKPFLCAPNGGVLSPITACHWLRLPETRRDVPTRRGPVTSRAGSHHWSPASASSEQPNEFLFPSRVLFLVPAQNCLSSSTLRGRIVL